MKNDNHPQHTGKLDVLNRYLLEEMTEENAVEFLKKQCDLVTFTSFRREIALEDQNVTDYLESRGEYIVKEAQRLIEQNPVIEKEITAIRDVMLEFINIHEKNDVDQSTQDWADCETGLYATYGRAHVFVTDIPSNAAKEKIDRNHTTALNKIKRLLRTKK